MELVFENGQILAKSQRSNVSLQNQRNISIMDLYEIEYNEDFKKSINNLEDTNMFESNKHVNDSSKMMKIDYERLKNLEFIPPDEQSMVPQRSLDESNFTYSSRDFTQESISMTYLSNSLDDESARTRRKRDSSSQVNNSHESNQRNNIDKKMRTLKDLLPNYHKDNNESILLDEAINYMTTLQHQVEMMSKCNRFVTPSMILPLEPYYTQMNVATSMQMVAPQFINHHHGLIPMQNSLLFNPMEHYSPQSCSNLDDARNQETLTDERSLFAKKS